MGNTLWLLETAQRRTIGAPACDKALRPVRPLFITQPVNQFVLVAGRVTAKVMFAHGGGQRREGCLRRGETLKRRRYPVKRKGLIVSTRHAAVVQ